MKQRINLEMPALLESEKKPAKLPQVSDTAVEHIVSMNRIPVFIAEVLHEKHQVGGQGRF